MVEEEGEDGDGREHCAQEEVTWEELTLNEAKGVPGKMNKHGHACSSVCECDYECVSACMHACVHVCLCVSVHVHVYT